MLVAGQELGIRVAAPYVMTDVSGDESVECVAHIDRFGSAAGVGIVGVELPIEPARAIAARRRMYLSRINEQSYAVYAPDLFVDTLNDWGWYGSPPDAPAWFSGAPWS